MMLKKFTGASTREALKKLREDLGEEAVILSTKQTASGTEILAALAEDLPAAVQRPTSGALSTHTGMGEPFAAPVVSAGMPNMVKRDVQPVSWKRIEEVREQERAQEREASQSRDVHREPPMAVRNASLREQEMEMTRPVMEELRQMREMLSEQMSVLNWRTAMEKNPARADLWRDLTEAGFSAVFARTVVEKLPDTLSGEDSRRWLGDVMTRNLNICPASDEIVERGGVYA
nr:hypothetical protein [Burkholderiales bacterium]